MDMSKILMELLNPKYDALVKEDMQQAIIEAAKSLEAKEAEKGRQFE